MTPEDAFAGIHKLMKALEGINGKSALDRKGELRNQFYLNLRRSPESGPQTSVVAFECSRLKCGRKASTFRQVNLDGSCAKVWGWTLLGSSSLRQPCKAARSSRTLKRRGLPRAGPPCF